MKIVYLALVLLALELLFACCPRHVSVFDHVLDLSLHCDDEEHDEIHHQNGPKDRNVEHLEEGEREGDHCCSTCPPPKLKSRVEKAPQRPIWTNLEFGQSPDEGLELGLMRRGGECLSVFVVLIRVVVRDWIHLRSQKCDEKVKVVDMKSIGDYVEALQHPEHGCLFV